VAGQRRWRNEIRTLRRATPPRQAETVAQLKEAVVSPLAEAIYALLRLRTAQPDPRITYSELSAQLRDLDEEFAHVNRRSQELYAALAEVGAMCRQRRLAPLPALVVRADTRRPGAAYFEGGCTGLVYLGDKIAAWREDVEAVKRTTYPAH
jgi:hypothetical protein